MNEWPEDRVDVIGQNGNDGLHYGEQHYGEVRLRPNFKVAVVPNDNKPENVEEQVDWLAGIPACAINDPECEACQ